MQLPVWALKGKDLNKWKRLHGLTLFHSQTAQVLFLDYGEPVAVMFLRPLNLIKEGRVIRGTFQLTDEVAKVHEWVVGRYDGAVVGFVVDATPAMLKFIGDHPGSVTYFDLDARERARKLLGQSERNKPWQTLKSSRSLLEESGWEYISSPSLESAPYRPPDSSLRQLLKLGSRSAPAPTA